MSNRVIGLTISDYQKIPQVIAIAAESDLSPRLIPPPR